MILTNASKRSTLLMLIVLAFCCYIQRAYAGTITTNTTNVGRTTTTALAAAAIDAEAAVPSSSEDDDDDDDDDGTTSDEKTAVQATDDTTVGWLSMARNVWDWINNDLNLFGGDDSTTTITTKSTTAAEGRTFSKIRRLKMMIILLILKLGVLSIMVALLVMLALKTFFLVKFLVAMNAVAILAKFLTLKSNLFGSIGGGGGHAEHHSAPASSWAYSNLSPHGSTGWAPTGPAPAAQHPSKEIHLHIHGGGGGHGASQPQVAAYSTYGVESQASNGWNSRSDPYGAYEPVQINEADLENELNNEGPISILPTRYPANHRSY